MRRPMALWIYYLERLGLRFRWRALDFYQLRLPPEHSPPSLPEIELRAISAADLRPEQVIGWIDWVEAQRLLATPGFQFFVATLHGRVVGSCWLETRLGQLPFLDCAELLPADTVYLTHLIVAREQRGRGVAPLLIDFAGRAAASIGKTRLAIACVPENRAVKKSIARVAAEKYLSIRYFRCLGLRLYRSSRQRAPAFAAAAVRFF